MTRAFNLELTEDELVLLDRILNELAQRPDFRALIPNDADRQAIHNLIALLERLDSAVVAEDYDERVAAARVRVLGEP